MSFVAARGGFLSGGAAAASVPDPMVPADGTQNVTGNIVASGNVEAAKFQGPAAGAAKLNAASGQQALVQINDATAIQVTGSAVILSTPGGAALLQVQATQTQCDATRLAFKIENAEPADGSIPLNGMIFYRLEGSTEIRAKIRLADGTTLKTSQLGTWT